MMTFAGLLLAGSASISLTINSTQQTVLIGEPVRLIANWEALTDVSEFLYENGCFINRGLRFVIEKGPLARTYFENPRMYFLEGTYGARVPPGYRDSTLLILRRGVFHPEQGIDLPTFPFPEPGRYRLKAIHHRPAQGGRPEQHAESNWLSFDVVAPQGSAAEVLEAIRPRADLDGAWALRNTPLGQVVAAHPDNAYAHFLRVLYLHSAMENVLNGRDPATREHVGFGNTIEAWRRQEYARLAAQALSQTWGAWEQDALTLAWVCAARGGDERQSVAIKERLDRDHPGWQDAPERACW